MSLASMTVEGVKKGADFLEMTGLHSAAENTLNKMKSGADFGDSILETLNARINDHEKLLAALGKKSGDELSNFDRARSLFYNKQGEFQKKRAALGIAGAYMSANIIGNGSLGIPGISTASWNR